MLKLGLEAMYTSRFSNMGLVAINHEPSAINQINQKCQIQGQTPREPLMTATGKGLEVKKDYEYIVGHEEARS